MHINKRNPSLDLIIALTSLAHFEDYRISHIDDAEGIAKRFRDLPPLALQLCEVLHATDNESSWCPPPPLAAANANVRAALAWLLADTNETGSDLAGRLRGANVTSTGDGLAAFVHLLEHRIPMRMTFSAMDVVLHPAAVADEPAELAPLNWMNAGFHDVANARRFLDLHGANVRWCVATKKWLLFDGMRWSPDSLETVKKLAIASMLEFLTRALESGDTDAQKFAKASLNHREIRDFLELAKSAVAIDASELDTLPMDLNFLNGTLSLETGILRPHRRTDYISKLVHYDYRPDAECPTWMAFLGRIMGASPDSSEPELERADRLISWLQIAFGYSLTALNTEKLLFICHGQSGNNGKTTLLNTFRQIISEYSTVIQIDTLMDKNQGNNSQADLADLRGARFVMTSEVEEGQKFAEARLKKIVQGVEGAVVKATRKYENPITFPETHKLWLDANHMPVIRGSDKAIWNRLAPIPFLVEIPADEIDQKFPRKLLKEAEGILAWAVAGAMLWHKQGLGRLDEITQARRNWRKDCEPLKNFFDDCCTRNANAFTHVTVLWEMYVTWCDRQRVRDRITRDQFTVRLEDMGFVRKTHRFDKGYSEPAWSGVSVL
jgi:putative DNA primase/helicase